MHEARRPRGTRSCVSHQGEAAVTFLILQDWKNTANTVRSGKGFDARARQINLRPSSGLHSRPNLSPVNVGRAACSHQTWTETGCGCYDLSSFIVSNDGWIAEVF